MKHRAKARDREEHASHTLDRSPYQKQMIEIAQKWHTMAAYEDRYGRPAGE
jgi:hypothetical protein